MNKDMIKQHPERFHWMLMIYNKLLGRNKIKIKGKSKIKLYASMMKNCKVVIRGDDNIVDVSALTTLNNVTIFIEGNHNRITIGERNGLDGTTLYVEDDNNLLQIGTHNRFANGTELVVMEETKLIIGNEGLFGPGVQLRTGDSHSILDMEGHRTNYSEDIVVEDNVWLAVDAIVMKGSFIPKGSVIGIRSLVNKKLERENSFYAGTPAKFVKYGVQVVTPRVKQ